MNEVYYRNRDNAMYAKTPIVSFVGKSNSGKTTLIVKVIKELKSRGLRVATIKHTHHNVDMDTKGKDSWKHSQAGADAVIIVSENKMGLFRTTQKRVLLKEMVETYLRDFDIIILEGYKTEPIPKIEVFRTENSDQMVCRDDEHLIAVIGDKDPMMNVPYLHIDADVRKIVDFIMSYLKINVSV
ncbi:MAG: molybdopterin-guanine dinucleotide biosynthesis protein B [Candidatus Kuenenia sp.]|nr:molybdopterin-guanine dinucleotide biosynthesis protein B [Candidatus Kuenenia sp.]